MCNKVHIKIKCYLKKNKTTTIYDLKVSYNFFL